MTKVHVAGWGHIKVKKPKSADATGVRVSLKYAYGEDDYMYLWPDEVEALIEALKKEIAK